MQGPIPLLRNRLKRGQRACKLSGLKFPEMLAARLDVTHEAGLRQDTKMLRYGLSRHGGPRSQLRDRKRPARTERYDES